MSSNWQQNTADNSGHSYGQRPHQRRHDNKPFGGAFDYRSGGQQPIGSRVVGDQQNPTNYRNNYYPNNEWSATTTPMSATAQPFNPYLQQNYQQNYGNNWDSNEWQSSYQNNNQMNGNNQKTNQQKRRPQQSYRRPPPQHNRPNDAMNSYTNDTNVDPIETNTRSSDNSRPHIDQHFEGSFPSNKSTGRTTSQRSDGNNRPKNDRQFDRSSNWPQNRGQRSGDNKKDNNNKRDKEWPNSRQQTKQSYDRKDINETKNEFKNEFSSTTSRDNNNSIKNDRRRGDNRRVNDQKVRPKPLADCEESQREIMEDMLRKGEFECMVCCDQIRIRDSVWSCEHCYNVYHLKCVKQWANSQSSKTAPADDQSLSWRCPACQAHHPRIPTRYMCFCGKIREPELNRYITPHSCGEMCGRKRKADLNRAYNCDHKCLLMCHPGSCPPCEQKVTRQCGCGQTSITVNCTTNDEAVVCEKICNKMLNCGQHFCQKVCHSDKCGDCPIVKTQHCFCGQHDKQVECNIDNSLIDQYSCLDVCNKTLTCSQHNCQDICHFGQCKNCPLDPKLVTHCCCNKTELKSLKPRVANRKSCTDPIPTCRLICDKQLVCGPDKEPHRCRHKCHEGLCEPCDQKTVIKCRCGANSDNIECIQLATNESKTFICKKRCNKKRVCGRHKCLNECCVDSEHKCDQICGRKLSCGQHTCEELCHTGSCPQCWNISWDELTCRCGASTKLPPIACGTIRPECGLICSRDHGCDHQIDHNCHDDAQCPPCTYFVPKTCYGRHESRAIQCYESGYSCGYLCGKPLDCSLHSCQMICHFGDCNECTLPCNKIRDDCEHTCGLKCHQKTSPDECPKSKCKKMIKVFCSCGRKTEQMPCFKANEETNARVSLTSLANQRIKNGESVNVSEILKNIKDYKYIQLKCDEKCAVVERNRQLAEALDIEDANFSPDPGPPKYSDLLKNAVRSDPALVADLYDKLVKLVLESKQSKLNFKNLNLPPMNSDNRHIVHELAQHFGCKTHAIDREPNRSVVVKAAKDKCYLPSLSLSDAVKEETETRILKNKITLKTFSFDSKSNDTNNSNLAVNTNQSMFSTNTSNTDSNQITKSTAKVIDYFDFNGD